MIHPLRNAIGRVSRACLGNGINRILPSQQRTFTLLPSSATSLTLIQSRANQLSLIQPSIRQFSSSAQVKLDIAEDDQSIDRELTPGYEPLRSRRDVRVIMKEYEMLSAAGPLTKEQYLGFLEELGYTYQFPEALRVLQDMKKAVGLTSKAYSYVIMAARPGLYFHELRFLFGEPMEGREDDIGAGGDTRVSDNLTTICNLMEEMKREGMGLDMFFYENMASSFAAGRQAGILINICMTLEKRGITPSTAFYNQLLLTLPRRGFMQRASALFDRLVLRNQANYQSHLIRLNWMSTSGRMEEAVTIFKDIAQKFSLNAVPYNIMISGYLRLGRRVDALGLYDEMLKGSSSSHPDRVTCSSFLTYFYNSSDLDGAARIMADLPKWGYPLTSRDFGLLIRLHSRYDPGEAVRVLDEVLKKDRFDGVLCNEVVRIVTDKRVMNEWKTVVMDKIMAHYSKLNSSQDSPLALLIPDRPPIVPGGHVFRNMVRELLSLMDAQGWTAMSSTMEYILRRMVLQKDTTKLAAYTNYLKDTNYAQTWNMRNLLIQASLLAGDKTFAQSMLSTMVRTKTPLTTATAQALASADIHIPPGLRRMGTDTDNGDAMVGSRSIGGKQNPIMSKAQALASVIGNSQSESQSDKIPVGI